MKNKIKKIIGMLSGVGSLVVPLIASAQPGRVDPATGTYDVPAILNNIINWVLGFAAAVAVIFLIIGGLRYITAGGNEDSIAAAKSTIMHAVLGLLVIVGSYVIVNFVIGPLKNALFK